MSEEKIVMYDSDEAATFQTGISGWVSRDGYFMGGGKDSEHLARWRGCTHLRCDCGAIHSKSWTKCDACIQKSRLKKFNSFPSQAWDESVPVCIFDDDKFFFSLSELEDWAEDEEIQIESMNFVICEPEPLRELDLDYFEQSIPQDMDPEDALSHELLEAVNRLNTIIRNHAPTCWYPANVRALIPKAIAIAEGRE